MRNSGNPLQRLVAMVAQTVEVEYDCAQTHHLLDEYADCVMRGEDAAAMLPLVHQHLAMCPNCREEFEALLRILQVIERRVKMEMTEHPREQSTLQIGARAPLFTVPDESNHVHSLAEALRSGKPVVLFFMRGEW